ncbi:MAG: class I SAM-dependent methyltransferase, partial [Betaproteobacteria bacterium]|nr:class I SAM-dependent methyltransferase [Betaproteobacteria bacterium]
MKPDTPTDLTFTGERFHPDKSGEMWFEHWHRYHLVRPLVSGLRVLDVAAGEGYGSALLAGSAAQVIGIDISTQAIAHARRSYAQHHNLSFIEAPCHRLPLPDHSVDVVISFETLEHIHEQTAFLREIKRVLTHNGWLAISTPNKAEYSDARGYQNEFHVKELYRDQLAALLATTFTDTRWLIQRNGFHSLIHHEQSPLTAQTGQLHLHSMPARQGQISAPLY